MSTNKSEPTRKVDVHLMDNGTPFAYSMIFHKNVKVHAEVQPPLQSPDLIIFVHGVSSEGEWYDYAERSLCAGLNQCLGLEGEHGLKENNHEEGFFVNSDKGEGGWEHTYEIEGSQKKWVLGPRKITKGGDGRFPVICSYWGYRATDNETDTYAIPLKNKKGDNYYDPPPESRKAKDPWFRGGGPFQNGYNQLVSLQGKTGFNNNPSLLGVPLPFSTQVPNDERDRLLNGTLPRHYHAHVAGRLAKLIRTIRNQHPEDTVTVLSHSQGTMIALAVVTIEVPDVLFVMNSPYVLENEPTTYISYPIKKIISRKARSATFADIVRKVAENKAWLKQQGYDNLLAGMSSDGSSWIPEGKTHSELPERDNHETTWIHCNSHDRVMGSSPLRSIGWQGLPDTKDDTPHTLFKQAGGTLYVRILGRNTPCGGTPTAQIHFSNLGDGKPFWDSTTILLQRATWLDPDSGQILTVNALQVPESLTAEELKNFDQDYAHDERQNGGAGYAYGQINPKMKKPVDTDYRYYISLYGYLDRKMVPKKDSGYYQSGLRSKEDRVKYEKQSREEMLEEVRAYVQRPTGHNALPSDEWFVSRVVAYGLSIGYCWHSWDKAGLEELRRQADWLESDDYYLSDKLTIPPAPPAIKQDVAEDTEQRRAEEKARLRNV